MNESETYKEMSKIGIDIHKIPLGADNCYVIKEEGTIMIDSGTPKKGKNLLKG